MLLTIFIFLRLNLASATTAARAPVPYSPSLSNQYAPFRVVLTSFFGCTSVPRTLSTPLRPPSLPPLSLLVLIAHPRHSTPWLLVFPPTSYLVNPLALCHMNSHACTFEHIQQSEHRLIGCFSSPDFGLGIYIQHGSESQFCCIFLIKVHLLLNGIHKLDFSDVGFSCCNQNTSYISPELRAEIITTVEHAVGLLGAPNIGVDDRHAPRLFSLSCFLGRLLDPANYFIPSQSKRKNPVSSSTVHQANLSLPVVRQASANLNTSNCF